VPGCKLKFSNLKDGVDFVVCKLCGWHALQLTSHLRGVHNRDSKKYNKQYGPVICENSKQNHCSAAKDAGNWLAKAKKRGDDLSEYKVKMSKAVSEAIMSNPEDRKRRAQVMSNVNRSDVMRKKASETAKRTSARKDVQENRAAQLKKWRDNNPEDFYNKCIAKMISSWQSKPEIELFTKISIRSDYCFKRNQRVKSKTFISKTKIKQIDFADRKKRVYVEFDGILHFVEQRINQLKLIQQKDRLLDEHIIKHQWMLIRVSYDQFSYRKSDYGFNKDCLDKVFSILDNPTPGVHYIGKAYE